MLNFSWNDARKVACSSVVATVVAKNVVSSCASFFVVLNFFFHVLVAKKPLVASDTSWIVRFDSAGCQCGCCGGDMFT